MKHSSLVNATEPRDWPFKVRLFMMINKKLFIFAILFVLPAVSLAETAYVTDILKLKLRASASNDAQVVTNLTSGDKLTVLQKEKRYTRVKTSDGEQGWVQSWFLTDKTPNTFLVAGLTKEKQTLLNKLAHAENKIKNFDSETSRENEQLKNSVATLSSKINNLTSTRNQLEEKLDMQANKLAKYEFAEQFNINLIIFFFFIFSFSVGFISSIVWRRTQERKRLWGYQLAH